MNVLKILFLLACACGPGHLPAQAPWRVMTYNIRLDMASDSLNAWPQRREGLIAQVLHYAPSILGVQEALPGQMEDLRKGLPGYSPLGVGRDDGKAMGEFSALWIDTRLLKVIRSSTFWLSATPEQAGSRGWDAACNRIVTWAECQELSSGKRFFVFNTHFDHQGQVARKNSALLLAQKVSEIAADRPAIVLGDFNAGPDEEPIRIILANEFIKLADTRRLSEKAHYGPDATFTGFRFSNWTPHPIDHIFCTSGIRVLSHATLAELRDGAGFYSDHFPVLAELLLK